MAQSWGSKETDRLRANVEQQLTRLLAQLQDLEDLQDELEPEEIEDIKADTLQQMQEFEVTLRKMIAGDFTLVDSLGSVQLALQAAISKAFRTPEVLKMFAKKDLGSLRNRLAQVHVNAKLGKVGKEQETQETLEILTALKKLGEPLSPEETNFLMENRTQVMAEFDKVDNQIGTGSKTKIMSSAAAQIKKAKT
eukprot:TRINITY_DN18829_c0_g1_i1.p1 TRINITY_DN18829_c0_g1~~TRINITY_DN18829_c0_g1_i1.p1  ORF type:complete len:204 (-),score=77.46 TRINITY_DN18829_c0_g1_i1:142-723(-)